MLTYLVQGKDGHTGKPRSLYVQTETQADALRFALERSILEPTATVIDSGQLPPEQPVLHALPPGVNALVHRRQTLFDRNPIIAIALGVTLGLVFYSILSAVVFLLLSLFLQMTGR